MLEFKNVEFQYESTKATQVLHDISFTVDANEFFCMIGSSGCGKSTILRLAAGFESPLKGSILYKNELIAGVSYERAMVFQEDAVFPWLRVVENIAYGLKARNVPAGIRRKRIAETICAVGLEGSEKLYPKELSGGMRKRVDLARALANDAQMLLMDEPFGALDAITKEKLQEELVHIWWSNNKTILFVTHDVEEALFLGDRVAVMTPVKNGGSIKVLEVPFSRPRDLHLKEDHAFQEMRRFLINELRLAES